jgi:hypothetical protein
MIAEKKPNKEEKNIRQLIIPVAFIFHGEYVTDVTDR